MSGMFGMVHVDGLYPWKRGESMSRVISVEGVTYLEVPGDSTVPCEFEIQEGGRIVLRFESSDLADVLMDEAVNNRLVALGLHYVAAHQDNGEEKRHV
jgi:hypothetical protein